MKNVRTAIKKWQLALLSLIMMLVAVLGLTLTAKDNCFISAKADAQSYGLTMQEGASIRIVGNTGIRFCATMEESEAVNASNYGIIMSDVETLNGAELTVENAKAIVSQEKEMKTVTEGGLIRFNAVLTNIQDNNLTKTYVARAFVTVEGTTYYTQNVERSPYAVAKAAHADGYTQQEVKDYMALDLSIDESGNVSLARNYADMDGNSVTVSGSVTIGETVDLSGISFEGECYALVINGERVTLGEDSIASIGGNDYAVNAQLSNGNVSGAATALHNIENVFGEGVAITNVMQGAVTPTLDGSALTFSQDWWVKINLSGLTIPANATQIKLTMKTNSPDGVKIMYNNIAGATGNNSNEFALTTEYAEYVIDLESGVSGTAITQIDLITGGWILYLSKVEFTIVDPMPATVEQVFGEGVTLTTTQGEVTAQEGALAFVNPDWWVKTTLTDFAIPANATQMILTMKSTGAVSGVKYNNIAGATGNNATEFALTSEYAEYVIDLESGAAGTEITSFEICTCGWPIYISKVEFVVGTVVDPLADTVEQVFGEGVTLTTTQGEVTAQEGALAFVNPDWWVKTTLTDFAIPANATQMILTMKSTGAVSGVKYNNIAGATGNNATEFALTSEYAEYVIDLESGAAGTEITSFEICTCGWPIYISKVEFVVGTVVDPLADTVEQVFGEGVTLTTTQGEVTAQEGALAFVNPDWWVKTTVTGLTIPANATQMILTMKSTGAVSGVKYNNIAGATGNNATEFALTSEYAEYVIDLESGAAGTEITAFEICTCGWPIYISKVEFVVEVPDV